MLQLINDKMSFMILWCPGMAALTITSPLRLYKRRSFIHEYSWLLHCNIYFTLGGQDKVEEENCIVDDRASHVPVHPVSHQHEACFVDTSLTGSDSKHNNV